MSHLTEEQISLLKKTLREENKRLRAEIRDELLRTDEEKYGALAGQVHDTGDESVADLLSDVNTAVVGLLIKELRDVEAAEERVAENSYGECDECGAEIPHERLLANPAALRCITCQEQHERLYAQEGKPTL
jgi:DnaK suppressor protein